MLREIDLSDEVSASAVVTPTAGFTVKPTALPPSVKRARLSVLEDTVSKSIEGGALPGAWTKIVSVLTSLASVGSVYSADKTMPLVKPEMAPSKTPVLAPVWVSV